MPQVTEPVKGRAKNQTTTFWYPLLQVLPWAAARPGAYLSKGEITPQRTKTCLLVPLPTHSTQESFAKFRPHLQSGDVIAYPLKMKG